MMLRLTQRLKFGLMFGLALGWVAAAWWLCLHATPVAAATLTVTTTNDSGAGSLRQALIDAQVGDTIVFSLSANAIITVASELTVTKFITIDGTTAANLSVSGNNATRVFNVTAPANFISFTVMNGNTGGSGGGLHSTSALTLTAMQFLSNTASNDGGGVRVQGAASVNGGRFENNHSTNNIGGGLLANSTLALTNTQFLSNTAQFGGGGAVVFGAASMNGGRFEHNVSTNSSGGGLLVLNTLALTNTQFLSNTAVNGGGGGAVVGGAASVHGGRFENNRTNTAGGGLFANSTLALTGTQFVNNTASLQGGGLYHNSGSGRVVNSLFARNVASNTLGAAIYLNSSGAVQILHTTIASPTLVSGSAIYVVTGTVGITNTMIASHTVGISRTGGVVFENYNLFFSNGANTQGGVASGGNSLTGNPAFVNPALDDYHLGAGSAALNVGTNAGIMSDFEGDTRPQGSGFDIGYDEFVEMPIVGLSAANSSPTQVGSATALTATITSGSNVVYTWNFGDGSAVANGASVTHTYAAVGAYTATVTATNSLSTVVATTFVTVQAPIVGLAATNSSPTELGNATVLTATLTSGSNVVYTWNFGDGTPTASGASVTHTYAVVGVYTATVTATNGVSTVVATTFVTITDTPIVGLSATNSSPTVLGSATALTATLTSGSNVVYTWNFGDGTPMASGAGVAHTYAAVGAYTATVTATNGVSTVVATTPVTIVASGVKVYLPLVVR